MLAGIGMKKARSLKLNPLTEAEPLNLHIWLALTFEPFPGYSTHYEEPYKMPYYYPASPYESETIIAPGVAYVANFEGQSDDGWYFDSGATHHSTNNMSNTNVREEFKGSDQRIIGYEQGLTTTHVGDAFLCHKGSHKYPKSVRTQIAIKDILLVPSITKNLLSISKLTADNNLSVEFLGNVCYVKDTLEGTSTPAGFC